MRQSRGIYKHVKWGYIVTWSSPGIFCKLYTSLGHDPKKANWGKIEDPCHNRDDESHKKETFGNKKMIPILISSFGHHAL